MPVTTTADESLAKTKRGIAEAINGLSEIVVEHVWGWNDYNEIYRMKMTEVFVSLLAIREKLGE